MIGSLWWRRATRRDVVRAAYGRQYYSKNRECLRQKMKKDRADNPEKYRQYARRAAEKSATHEGRLKINRNRYIQRKAKSPERYQEATYDEWKSNEAQRRARRERIRKEKARIRDEEYRQMNREKIRARAREHSRNLYRDPEKRKHLHEMRKANRARNIEEHRRKERERRQKNLDRRHETEYRSRHRKVTTDERLLGELVTLSKINSLINDNKIIVPEDLSPESIAYRERIAKHIRKYPERYLETLEELQNERQQK